MRRGTRLDQPLRSEPSLDPENYMPSPYAAPFEVARAAIEAYVRATASYRQTPEAAAKRAANDVTDDIDAAAEISRAVVLAYHRHLAALPPEADDPDVTNEELAEELAIEELEEENA